MAATKTLVQLRAIVRELADQETAAAASAFVDDTELDARINEGLQRLYDLLIQCRGQLFESSTHAITTVASQAAYSLPADFYHMLGVRADDGSGDHTAVPTFEYRELPMLLRYQENGGSGNGVRRYRYRLRGSTIEIRPQPTVATHTITLDYAPTFTELVADTDTFDGVNGWEKWACYTAAIDIANKEENYELVQSLTMSRGHVEQQIKALGAERDAANPPHITDVEHDWSGAPAWWHYLEPPP